MGSLAQVSSPTIDAIEAAVAAGEERRQDLVVRGSAIGKCERHLWYRFRWAHPPEAFGGRILRLFNTGHVEEARMVGWLQAAGVDVQPVDPVTGDQWEVTALDGHFAGHLDGVCTGIIEAPVVPHLLECKTHNAKSFAQLLKHGVAISKPEHMAQMQIYMHLMGLTRAFYLAKNKDTDELHSERVRYDATLSLQLLAKAQRVRDAKSAPARISEDPDGYGCRFCHSRAVCHLGEFPIRNCRSCLHSTPMPEGQWACARHERDLSREDQAAGCAHHLFIPALIPGEQIDADETAETVTYQIDRGDLAGTQWTDGHELRPETAVAA